MVIWRLPTPQVAEKKAVDREDLFIGQWCHQLQRLDRPWKWPWPFSLIRPGYYFVGV